MSDQDLSSLSLDELFKEARAAMRRQKAVDAAKPRAVKSTEPTLEVTKGPRTELSRWRNT